MQQHQTTLKPTAPKDWRHGAGGGAGHPAERDKVGLNTSQAFVNMGLFSGLSIENPLPLMMLESNKLHLKV